MADFGKIKGKGKNRFGDIPTPDETDNNLDAPEIAPADPSVEVKTDLLTSKDFVMTPVRK
jgi:hypothetical protein